MNVVLDPYVWEGRIQRGRLAGELIQPIHPIHRDIGYFAGWKFVVIVMWLPIAVVLTLIFKPELSPSPSEVGFFFIALWGGFFVRFMALWALGLITFWTTRVHALYDLYFTAELLLSGRLVPLSVMPGWVQGLANVLPFKWAFEFPIETLIGRLSTGEIIFGIGMQLFWTLVGLFVGRQTWHAGLKRFTSVGN